MKRWISGVLIICLALSTAGCSKKEVEQAEESLSPQNEAYAVEQSAARETVESFLTAFFEGDLETAMTCLKTEEALPSISEESEQITVKFLQLLDGHVQYETGDVVIMNEEATVIVQVKMIDLADFLRSVAKDTALGTLSSGDLTVDGLMGQIEKALDSSNQELRSYDCPFLLEKVDGVWLITDGEGIEEAILGKLKNSSVWKLIRMLQ